MSRTDQQDFEYPPGLGAYQVRGGGERDQVNAYQHASSLATYGSQDRRQSSGIQSYSSYGGFAPRSLEQKEYGFGVGDFSSGPNRHNPSASNTHLPLQSFSPFNHHLTRPSPPSPPPPSLLSQAALYQTSSPNDGDAQYYRQSPNSLLANNTNSSRSTLWWGEIEPWMDEEYAKQVCTLMGWDPVNIKVPHPAPDPATGQQANNPGYCFLTFPTPSHAASVLAQVNSGPKSSPVTMPNSSKPFVLNWASSVNSASSSSPTPDAFVSSNGTYAASAQQQYPKEYSIFVGDLAPETSNSDLVAVFRNPVLGLRNDREPKFIRPFLSCKSAKIMLDPVTGVSRGYGFVRFTDEADQQRALIEMHGLYCLSRPMRISPATAKFKPPATLPLMDLPQVQFSPPSVGVVEPQNQPITLALPLPNSTQTKSVSAPIASGSSNGSLIGTGVAGSTSGSSIGGSTSSNSLSTGTGSSLSISTSGYGSATSATSDEMMNLPNNVLAQIAQQYANGDASPIKTNNAGTSYAHEQQLRQVLSMAQSEDGPPRFTISEESWKHHAQARAILGNLIGPNGEQFTSTDPYNTTVFVGGLSPLISEDTLRTFFAPFGDIHYVKVPVGKHCGFVQFVRKADAEKAIEKMQGFPIGGSRIRLSWGRSQYKAAQAAAQAAQAAALQAQYAVPTVPNAMTQEQAIQLLQNFTIQQGYPGNTNSSPSDGSDGSAGYINSLHNEIFADQKGRGSLGIPSDELPPGLDSFSPGYMPRPEVHRTLSTFSPFSPDPSLYAESKRRDSTSRLETLPHPSKAYAPGFFPLQTQDLKIGNGGSATGLERISPTSTRPSSASRYGSFAEKGDHSAPPNRAPGRAEAPTSRPPSGQTSSQRQGGRERLDFDPLHDLNGTLASLDLDHPWKSSGHIGNIPSNGQFHLAGRTPSP